MRTDPEVTTIVRSWLSEGVDRMPERVLDAVLDEVPSTPQRRHTWPAWRFSTMSTPARLGVAAAAIAVVAVAGYALLPRNASVGVPGPTASPTAPTATLPALYVEQIDNRLVPGTYRAGDPFAHPFSLSLGLGWRATRIQLASVQLTKPGASMPWLVVEQAQTVIPDPCHVDPAPGGSPAPPSVASLVTSLTTMTGFDPGPVTDTSIGGRAAKTFVLTNAINADSPECPAGGLLNFWRFPTPTGTDAGPGTNGGATDRLWVVDVNGTPIVIDAIHFADTPAADVADVEAVVSTIEFE